MSVPVKGKKRTHEENGFRWFVQVAVEEMKKKFPEADEDYLVAGCIEECQEQWPSMSEHDKKRFYQCAEIREQGGEVPKKKKKTAVEDLLTPNRSSVHHNGNVTNGLESPSSCIREIHATPDRNSESENLGMNGSTLDSPLRKKKKKKKNNDGQHEEASEKEPETPELNVPATNGTPQKEEKKYQNHEPKTPDEHNASSREDREQKSKKKKRDPNLPKQGISAFFFFLGEQRETLKAANPDFKNPEIAQELGRRWKEMSAGERRPYLDRQEEDKIRYNKELAEYKQSQANGGVEA